MCGWRYKNICPCLGAVSLAIPRIYPWLFSSHHCLASRPSPLIYSSTFILFWGALRVGRGMSFCFYKCARVSVFISGRMCEQRSRVIVFPFDCQYRSHTRKHALKAETGRCKRVRRSVFLSLRCLDGHFLSFPSPSPSKSIFLSSLSLFDPPFSLFLFSPNHLSLPCPPSLPPSYQSSSTPTTHPARPPLWRASALFLPSWGPPAGSSSVP